MADFVIKQHDTWPPLRGTLTDANGAVNLTAATSVMLHLKSAGAGSTVIVGACDVIGPATDGVVQYEWKPEDTAAVNTFTGEFEVTWADSTVTTFPNDGYFSVEIKADLA